jgi:hypothetical protein
MIIPHPILISRWRTRRLNPPDKTLLGQHLERVVYRLPRNRPDFGTNFTGDVFRRAVRPPRHSPQHRQTLRRNLHPMLPKKVTLIITHNYVLGQNLDLVKI